MTAISDFVANPKQFLKNNVLRVLFTMPAQPNSIGMFKFERKNYDAVKLATGANIPCYSLVPIHGQEATIFSRNATSANRDYLRAYWCPYEDDAMHSIMVGAGADFMFTSNMDGCSFGVGSATPTGDRRVAHINLRSQPNSHNLQDGTLAVQSLTDHHVKPDRYMKSSRTPGSIPGEIKATTIGIRNTATGAWSFHYQQYRLLGGQINQVYLLALKNV
ncbi:hypothetical protein QLH52_23405 [Methylomonas sp. OY6]|uniref:Uncharacterized protein n=1 Tax=Methylomonas defluvii TaxID=3045149 RepID=A0ABU4UN24_9GAMM|nr:MULTISPECIES: hypothetical protein [unclassified Methylomonas]MDX8130257.1 hypothetical protein [Methylomonas sp. OY6]PKD39908.1 hypothetical protein CWO84_12955 [Methylomonas sp. Kb3]